MAIPTDLAGVLSEFGLPVGAGALAYGLVKGADALEADAREERLQYISAFLKEPPLVGINKFGSTSVPFIFDRVFGNRAISVKFISRSVIASLLFLDDINNCETR